jgi:hypothetical protein
MKTRFAGFVLASATLVACGGDDGGNTPIDGQDVDADVDAQDIDAPPPPTYSGSISLVEAAVLNPGTTGALFGQGPQISILLTSSAVVPGPTMQQDPLSATGCKAWEYTAAQAAAATAGADEGVVAFTLTGTAPPTVPSCAYTAGVGYLCQDTATVQTGGVIANGPQAGTATLTDAGNTFNDGNSLGRYLRISGATNAANNGVFPIVARTGATTLVYANPARVAETLPAAATHVNIYGLGPIPGAADPGFINNDNGVTVTLTAGGGNHFATFTSMTGQQTFGDDFTLATAEAAKLNAIPKTGAAFTITCAAQGCPQGSATGTVLNIVTTDTPTTGLSPFAMPLPTTRQVRIRCGVLGASAITVPAAYSALIQSSGATRIQASFIRGALLGGGPPEISVVAGHAIVGFTN